MIEDQAASQVQSLINLVGEIARRSNCGAEKRIQKLLKLQN